MPEKRKEKIFAYIVMGIYLLFLCWLILFKLADSINKIPSMRGINLIPFHYDHDQEKVSFWNSVKCFIEFEL